MKRQSVASAWLAVFIGSFSFTSQAWQPVTNGVSATASINRISGSGQLMALYVSSGTTGLYVSTNAGEAWTRLVNLPGSSSSTMDVLVDNGVIFVARASQSAGTNAIIMSTNKGASWFGSTNVPTQNFSLLAKDGANVYAAANGSSYVWRSTNNGLNWEVATNSTYNGGTIRALGASGGRLLATTSSGFMLLTGTNWTKLNTDATGANNVRMAVQGGVLLGSSTQANRRAVGLPDGSNNLFNATNGLGEGFVNLSDYYDVVAGPDAAYMISRQYGSTYTTFLYATTNGGTNWVSQPTTGIASASPGSLAVSDRGLFAAFGSSGGLYRVGLTNGQLLVPPTITSNPVANVTVHPGTNITLYAAATSSFPLSLQWQRDGVDLPGETNATLNLLNAQTNTSGSYRLAAINAGGTNLSTAATVLVIPRAPGWPDLTFNPGLARDAGGFLVSGSVLQVAALTNNQILVGGQFTTVNAVPTGNGFYTGGVLAFGIARLNPNGSADTSFQALPGVSSNGTVRALALSKEGRIFIAGDFKSYNNTPITNLARLQSDGSLDTGFAPTTILPANDFANGTTKLLPLADGRLVIMGNFTNINGVARTNLACFNTDGSLDTNWPAGSGVPYNFTLQDIGPGADGNVMVAGTFPSFNGTTSRKSLVSIGTNGAINTNFNHTLNNSVSETELQSGGLLWAVGSFTQHTNNGVATPVVKPVRLAPDGRVVSVSPTNLNSPQTLFSQEDGSLIVAFYNAGAGRYQLLRFTATGAIDQTFSSGGDFNSSLTGLAMTPSGDLYAAGFFGTVAGATMPGLAKLFAASTNVPPTTPIFTLLPSPAAALPGSNLTLRAAATGVGEVGLFWLQNGLPVMDATNGTLVLTNLNAGLAGNYQVVASNSFGAITSAPVSVSVAAAPVITLDLPSATGGSNGATVTLTVAVTGTEPLTYTWYRSGSPLSGSTTNSHTITNLGAANTAGDYRVIITNAFGSATSTLATVSVGTPPTFFSQPGNQTLNGLGNVSLSAIAGASTSFPLTFRWYQNNSLVRTWTTNSNLGDTLTISNAVPTNAGSYFVVLSNFAGVATSTVRTVTIRNPFISPAPQQTSVREGFSTNFTAAATGTMPIDLYWYRRRTSAPLATNFLGTGASLPIVNATRADASYAYFVVASNVWGQSTSSPVSLIVQFPPAITNISPGTNIVSEINRFVSIWVQNEGQPYPSAFWFKDGIYQPSLFSEQILFNSVQTSNAGTYQLVLSNYLGMATSPPIVLNVQPARGPTITNQPPATRLVSTSGYLNLGAGVDGSPTLYYRWFRDGTPVTGWQNYDVLSLSSPTTNQSGNYTVVVTNSYGSATSTVCAVTVQAPQPASYANKQFVKIADSLTLMPGLGTNRFSGFRDAFLRGGQVWFGGTVSGVPFSVGVYHWSNNVLTSLVNTNANVPGTSSKFTNFYGSTFLSDGKVIFGGNGNDNHTGLYAVTNGSVVTLYDNTTLMPGRPDTFDRFGWPAVAGNQFAFLGFHHYTTNSLESYRAVYVSSNGVLTTLADTNTPLPGIGGTFVSSSSQVGFDGETVAWWGINQDTNGGIFRITRTTPIASVSDESMNNPATGLPFDGFISPPNVTTGRVYHVGHDEGFNSVLLYRDAGGPLTVIAKPGDPVPGRALTFDSVGYPFQVSSRSGCFFDGADGAGYYGIFHWNGTTSTKVIDTFDSLDGSPIAYVFVADAEDDCVLFYVTFTNGRQALYATLPAGQTFNQWAAGYTFPGGLSAPNDDADGDGIPNIFEFYFASNPTNAASGALPTAVSVNVSGQVYPALTFVRSRNVSGVTLLPQVATDPTFANPLGNSVHSVVDLGNGTEQVTIRSTVNSTVEPAQFLRIRLSLP